MHIYIRLCVIRVSIFDISTLFEMTTEKMDGSRIFAEEDIPPALLYNAASVVPMKLTVKIAHNGTYLVTSIVNQQIIQMNRKAIQREAVA